MEERHPKTSIEYPLYHLATAHRFRLTSLCDTAVLKGIHLSNLGLTQNTKMIRLLAVVHNKRYPANWPKYKQHHPRSSPCLPCWVCGDPCARFLMTIGALGDEHGDSGQCRIGTFKGGSRIHHRGWWSADSFRRHLLILLVLLLLRSDFGNRSRHRYGTWLRGVHTGCIFGEG